MRRRGLLGAGVAMLLVASAFVTPASATNTWNGYHWATPNRDPLNVVNTIGASLDHLPTVGPALNEWTIVNVIEPTLAATGPVTIAAKNGNANYLGVAQIWLENGHISKGRVVLNTLYYWSLDTEEWDHVLCQEIGHVLGLDHRDAPGTCMNDHVLDAPTPGTHDLQTLNDLYAHTDEGGGDGGTCRGGPRKCGNGQWITVHAFPATGFQPGGGTP